MEEYNYLYKYYDELLNDDEYLNKLIKHSTSLIDGNKVLDMACGTGNASIILNKLGYNVQAFDISKTMIDYAKSKDNNINYYIDDMLTFKLKDKVDLVICYMDSLNYLSSLNDLEQVFNNVYNCLNNNGYFIFDYHSIQCLNRYKEEYIEEGIVLDTNYQWSIISDNNMLLSTFVFYEEYNKLEQHIQYIFDIELISNILSSVGFKVKVTPMNDEKYYIQCKKETL